MNRYMGKIRAVAASGVLRSSAGALLVLFLMFASMVAGAQSVSIPKDQSPHDTNKEWWYYTGHLSGVDPGGHPHQYGFELTFFRVATAIAPPGSISFPYSDYYVANFAITDLTRDTFQFDQRSSVQPDVLPPGGGFDIQLLDWSMSGLDNSNVLHAAFVDGSYALDLALDSPTPAVLHGNNGIIPYAPFGSSGYYSYTNLRSSGVLVDHGTPIAVTGIAWHDHQWFDSPPLVAGWDWFSVQLDNGTQYMVYLVRDGTGNIVQRIGTQVNADDSYVNLDPASLGDVALGHWFSPVTLTNYSSGWNVTVPGGQLTITPQRRNQELYPIVPPLHYWEGASLVSGTVNGQPVTGVGYTEITPVQLYP